MTNYRPGAQNNQIIINDQRTNQAYEAVNANFFKDGGEDTVVRKGLEVLSIGV